MKVAIPKEPFDLAQQAGNGFGLCGIVMRKPFDVLLHDGDAHGDVEPIQDMLRGRCHVSRHVDDRVSTVSHECHWLVFLPTLILQNFMQSPLGLVIMTLDKPKVAARAICGDGFADGDLEMRLTSVARPNIATVDTDGDLALRVGKLGALVGTGFNETVTLIRKFGLHPRGHTPQMSADGVWI